jgi:hypothetical protein
MEINHRPFTYLLIFGLLIAFPGCNKDEFVPQSVTLIYDFREVLELLPGGLTTSGDNYAQECYAMIREALDMSAFIENIEVPENAEKTSKKGTEGTWRWSWNYGDDTWDLYWTYEEENERKFWTMDIQSGAGPRFDYLEAWETTDGGQGELVYNFDWETLYDDGTDNAELYWKYTWDRDASGNYNCSWYYHTEESAQNYFRQYDLTVNGDGSGTINYYFAGEPYYQMEWDMDGSGSWIYYFDGMSMTGSWMAL